MMYKGFSFPTTTPRVFGNYPRWEFTNDRAVLPTLENRNPVVSRHVSVLRGNSVLKQCPLWNVDHVSGCCLFGIKDDQFLDFENPDRKQTTSVAFQVFAVVRVDSVEFGCPVREMTVRTTGRYKISSVVLSRSASGSP